MRKLTEEELKLAPEWATHYTVDCCNDVIYQNGNLCWWSGLSLPLGHNKINPTAKPINKPKKQFDITKYDFSDCYVLKAELEGGCSLSFELQSHELGFVSFNKNDVIAMARALSVNAEDL